MTKSDTGGSAFPSELAKDWRSTESGHQAYELFGGMTLLDYFAGQAMQAILSSSVGELAEAHHKGELENPTKFIAETAYDQAEAMIAEKRRREGE